MLFLYNVILVVLFFVSSPFLIYKLITDKRYRTGLSERLGFISNSVLDNLDGNRPIWFHAASVGEVNASVALLKKIRERWPERKLLVSTFTATGNIAAREKLDADAVIFLPADLPFVAGRALKMINPSMLILMETELWPNLINNAGKRRIPVVVVNGRISDRSYGKYWFISPLLRRVFESVSLFLMQSDGDARRIVMLGAGESKVFVTGNIKFDVLVPNNEISFMNEHDGPVFIAGSTRNGEEAQILDVYKGLLGRWGGLRLILAPRHTERVGEIEELLRIKGFEYVRRSMVKGRFESHVLLLDTLGELAHFYKYGKIVFVGGSLVPVGGQNPLEPAISGRPVLFGPHMENFRDISQILIDRGGGVRVNNANELKEWIEKLLDDEELCDLMGENARKAVLANQGAVQKTVDRLLSYIS